MFRIDFILKELNTHTLRLGVFSAVNAILENLVLTFTCLLWVRVQRWGFPSSVDVVSNLYAMLKELNRAR